MDYYYINKKDLNSNYFHFTDRKNLESIKSKGLVPNIGNNAKNIEKTKKIFYLLEKDISDGTNFYNSTEKLKELYYQQTGKKSNVHKYYVLRWDEQSNTIPAHLYKDGLRHIHPDPEQARSITVREAARLQSFDDDYEFIGSMMDQYKMIGNAVPPKFSNAIAKAIKDIFNDYVG